jgi:hypothetical protein
LATLIQEKAMADAVVAANKIRVKRKLELMELKNKSGVTSSQVGNLFRGMICRCWLVFPFFSFFFFLFFLFSFC